MAAWDSETEDSTSYTNGSLEQWGRGLYISYQWQPETVKQWTLHLIPMKIWDSKAEDSTSHTNGWLGQQGRGLYISHQWRAGTARQRTLHLTPIASWDSKAGESTSHTNGKLGQQGRRVTLHINGRLGQQGRGLYISHQWLIPLPHTPITSYSTEPHFCSCDQSMKRQVTSPYPLFHLLILTFADWE